MESTELRWKFSEFVVRMTSDDTREVERKAKLAEKMRKWRAAHRSSSDDTTRADSNAKAAARIRKWRAANPQSPEQKAKAAARSRKWRQENKQRYAAYMKAWRNSKRARMQAKQQAPGRKKPVVKSTAVTNLRLCLLRFLSFIQPL